MEDELKRRKREKAMLIVLTGIFSIALIAVIVFGAVHLAGKAADFVEDNKQVLHQIGLPEEERMGTSRAQLSVAQPVDEIDFSGILDLSPVVEEVMPSIVAITSTMVTDSSPYTDPFFGFWGDFGGGYSEEIEGSGSGIIFEINDEEMLIMTNNHVVKDATAIQITFLDGSIAPAAVKGVDNSADLALVAVKKPDLSSDTMKAVKAAKLGDSDSMKVGQMSLAIGNALGYGQSLTVGYISAKERVIQVEDRTMTVIQTDAAINPGNSGGALINIDGEVIGINSAKLAQEDVEGIGYAIPITTALPILERLKKYDQIPEKDRGYLGITCKDVSEEMNSLYQMPLGVFVYSVSEDSPAEKAGMIVGDIVTKVDGAMVENFEQLRSILDYKKVGEKVTVTFMRYENGEYSETEVNLKLGAKPEE